MHNTIDKDAMISVIGKQKYSDEEEQSLELITGGRLQKRDNTWFISYPESEMTGMDGTETTFELDADGGVTLRRRGTVAGEMHFQEGRRVESLYNVGADAMLVSIRASRVRSEMTETGGRLELEYAIDIEHSWSGFNHYDVKVRTLEPPAAQ